MAKSVVVFVMGPPGSGKSTQAKQAAKQFGFEEFDTGEAIRNLKNGTGPLAEWFRRAYATGRLAPPPLVVDLVIEKTAKLLTTSTGLIFHGSPRTLREAEALVHLLVTPEREGKNLLLVLDTQKPETVRRILERGKTGKRPDDTAEGVENRWEEYLFRTEPALRFLQQHMPYRSIDGNQSIAEVAAAAERHIAEVFGISPRP